MNESPCWSTYLPEFGVVRVLDFGHSHRCVMVWVTGFLEEDYKCKVPFLLYHIKVTYHQHDLWLLMLTLLPWLKECLSGFSTVRLFFLLPFPYCILWKKFSVCSPHSGSGNLSPLPLSWSSYIICLEFFCMGDLSVRPHLWIYSVIYLYQYGLMNIYIILLVIIRCCFNLNNAQIVPALAIGSSFGWLLCPIDMSH